MKKLAASYKELTESIRREDGAQYPGKTLVTLELEPGYDWARKHKIDHMLAVNEAHLVMLIEQNIIDTVMGTLIMRELEAIDYQKYAAHTYTGKYEDLFFEMEHELIERTNGAGGNLHLARSRNDMSLCLDRMAVRKELLELICVVTETQNAVALFAEEHKDTLYVVHTHTQHAQPGVLGHYFLGAVDLFDRDLERLHHAYDQVNLSPMGAAAITTTGFPINRQRVSELLGFRDYIFNSYDAIGNADFCTETASVLGLAALDLGRLVTDMLLWATDELSMIRVADGYISTSSIMPQKRNPIALEHLRASLSVVKGLADSVLYAFFKSPYGDISDHEDAEYPLAEAISLAMDNFRLFSAVIGTLEVNTKLLSQRAHESFSVVTEMADELYRSFDIPFRQAHHVVAALVKEAEAQSCNLKHITEDFFAGVFKTVTGKRFSGDFAAIQKSMDPGHFVASRTVAGGTAPGMMTQMTGAAQKKIAQNVSWIEQEEARILNAAEMRKQAVHAIMKN
jgi:argininosuccinate lyase